MKSSFSVCFFVACASNSNCGVEGTLLSSIIDEQLCLSVWVPVIDKWLQKPLGEKVH